MRAPFQILAIPFKRVNDELFYCVFHRSDHDQWQFIAGGGEDLESPEDAAKREIFEESGIVANIIRLKSMCYIPTDIFPMRHLYDWPSDTYVVPEYAFGFECHNEILLSHEHIEYNWLKYEDAMIKLKWDSNRTALYELNCRLRTTR